jgi:hypothetical protein
MRRTIAILATAGAVTLGLGLAQAPGTVAQTGAGCAGLTQEEAQAQLDADPTYATRDSLDPDADGVACEPDELAQTETTADPDPGSSSASECGSLSAEEAQTALDAATDDATRAALDPDGDGTACEVGEVAASGLGAGGRTVTTASTTAPTVNGLPSTGAGAAAIDAALLALAAVAALGSAGAARAAAVARARS